MNLNELTIKNSRATDKIYLGVFQKNAFWKKRDVTTEVLEAVADRCAGEHHRIQHSNGTNYILYVKVEDNG